MNILVYNNQGNGQRGFNTEGKDLAKHSFIYKDLGFAIEAEVKDCQVEYRIFDIVSTDVTGLLYYYYPKDRNNDDWTTKTAEAAVFANGHVKWDGCSNWYFDEQDANMIHGCNREDIEKIGKVLTACWDLTAMLCSRWNP